VVTHWVVITTIKTSLKFEPMIEYKSLNTLTVDGTLMRSDMQSEKQL